MKPGRAARACGAVAGIAGVAALPGCGDDGRIGAPPPPRPALVVVASGPLAGPLRTCAPRFPDARVRLGGAASGAGADVLTGPLARLRGATSLADRPTPIATRDGTAYAAAPVRGGAHPEVATAFVDDLLAGACHAALRAGGFGDPP